MKKLLSLLLVLCVAIGLLPAMQSAAAENPYKGKVISILGDSISTFEGYIPTADGFNLEHLTTYPQNFLLTDVNETWWMQVISQTESQLGINDSWRGTTVSGCENGMDASCMANLVRIRNLGSNGTPDVILFYGGTNDLAHKAEIGQFDPEQAPQNPDLLAYKWDNLADGYVNTLLRLKFFYPKAQIISLLPTFTKYFYTDERLSEGNSVLAAICEHYGVPYVDLRYCGISKEELIDGVHPNAKGMDYITDAVMQLLEQTPIESGENVVYSVTHDLVNAQSSTSYYKGISRGQTFGARITGRNVDVRVVMRGKDITQSCYSNGAIRIDKAVGDIYITAKGEDIYAERLQQLPKEFCKDTNLWPLLEPREEYYGNGSWKTHPSGNVYSVTIPVQPGEQLWATSFHKAGVNGGSVNGIDVTWFTETDVLKTVAASSVYKEFSTYGYITVPEKAVAVNVPMWSGDETNELYILSRDHCYMNNVCTGCGKNQINEDLQLSASVTVGASMSFNYSITAVDIDRYVDFFLVVRHEAADGSFTATTYNAREMIAMNHPVTGQLMMYYASYGNISAKEMGDKFVATLYAIDTNGKLCYGPSVTSSVKQALLEKFDVPATTTLWKTMAIDMLKYGAAAQIHFGYDTENLVTADLTKAQLAYATTKIPVAVDSFAVSGEGANVATNITLGARVELNLSCIAMDVTDPSAVKCVITDENGEIITELATEHKAKVMFSALYDDVGAKQMRKLIKATFFEGERPISKCVTWSVESYVAQICRSSESTLSEVRMVSAMLIYGDSVAAYLESIRS